MKERKGIKNPRTTTQVIIIIIFKLIYQGSCVYIDNSRYQFQLSFNGYIKICHFCITNCSLAIKF